MLAKRHFHCTTNETQTTFRRFPIGFRGRGCVTTIYDFNHNFKSSSNNFSGKTRVTSLTRLRNRFAGTLRFVHALRAGRNRTRVLHAVRCLFFFPDQIFNSAEERRCPSSDCKSSIRYARVFFRNILFPVYKKKKIISRGFNTRTVRPCPPSPSHIRRRFTSF